VIGYASQTDGLAAEFAVHFERGGDPANAVVWLERAAAGVRRRFADREAVAYLKRAIALLSHLPECEERNRRELALRFGLSEALMFAAGYAPVSNVENLKRAVEISSKLGEPQPAVTALSMLIRAYWVTPDLVEAEALLDPLLDLDADIDDRPLRALTQANVSIVALMKGELQRARHAAEVSWELIAEEENYGIPRVTSDPAVQALYSGALAEWLMGYPERAEALARRSAERTNDPYRQEVTLFFRGHLAGLMRSIGEVERVDLELERLQEEYGFGLTYPYGPARKGWLLLQRGDSDAAIACMQEGLSASRRTGSGLHTTFLLATLAEVRLARGEAEEGLAEIEEAFAFAEKTGERYLEAELHRLRGELLLLEPRVEAATHAFERALAIARHQGALSLELRAAMSQARLLKREGRKTEARDLLSPVYAGFTEGFETPDLQEARTLLAGL
jgi:tetratricopeptide (TPR) repeat protein